MFSGPLEKNSNPSLHNPWLELLSAANNAMGFCINHKQPCTTTDEVIWTTIKYRFFRMKGRKTKKRQEKTKRKSLKEARQRLRRRKKKCKRKKNWKKKKCGKWVLGQRRKLKLRGGWKGKKRKAKKRKGRKGLKRKKITKGARAKGSKG